MSNPTYVRKTINTNDEKWTIIDGKLKCNIKSDGHVKDEIEAEIERLKTEHTILDLKNIEFKIRRKGKS